MPKRHKAKKVEPAKEMHWDKFSFNAAWIISLIMAFGVVFGQGWAYFGIWSIILVIFGIITGFTHSIREISPFILIAVALAIFTGSSLVVIPIIGEFFSELVSYFISYITPAALIIALRKLYGMFN